MTVKKVIWVFSEAAQVWEKQVNILLLLLLLSLSVLPASAGSARPKPVKPLIMAHYLPWFQAKPFRAQWGWHWTMGHEDPDKITAGKRQIAAQDYPLIGPYDSSDLDALRCQVLLMKLSGIDGVIIDWYGRDNYYDYAANNENVKYLIPLLQQAGLHFAICYEDQTVPTEIKGGVFPATQAIAHGQQLMKWMQAHFFSSPAYLRLQGRPILLSFGTPYYNNSQWEQLFSVLPQKPLFFTELDRREPTASIGGFGWPQPSGGTQQALGQLDNFYQRAKAWPMFIAVAFPRFDDFYQQAGVGPSWGNIADQGGRTYTDTLRQALQSGAPIVQIATWNDWGEGTQIEPSVEYQYRDLVTTQHLRRQYLNPHFPYSAADLSLPVKWYRLRQKYTGNHAVSTKLAAFFPLVISGHLKQARALLTKFSPAPHK